MAISCSINPGILRLSILGIYEKYRPFFFQSLISLALVIFRKQIPCSHVVSMAISCSINPRTTGAIDFGDLWKIPPFFLPIFDNPSIGDLPEINPMSTCGCNGHKLFHKSRYNLGYWFYKVIYNWNDKSNKCSPWLKFIDYFNL